MTDNNNDNNGIDITLNCLIVPIGNLFNLPNNQVAQVITINTNQRVSRLENVIRSQLKPPFVNLYLTIREIHPGIVNERPMDSQAFISVFLIINPYLERTASMSPYILHNFSII
ncbi:hypothetical protein RhiirC2_803319 [Rhizophagus irregularis]|uniref:Uncharacterized protein n=1 Tax=Rhizophagus irregularis TaxID=588596 RepID=A0A2N1LNZ8_9GLOM|nr:hypothetical protein RhiirC2_803319 [Rhizophagus irregularis]